MTGSSVARATTRPRRWGRLRSALGSTLAMGREWSVAGLTRWPVICYIVTICDKSSHLTCYTCWIVIICYFFRYSWEDAGVGCGMTAPEAPTMAVSAASLTLSHNRQNACLISCNVTFSLHKKFQTERTNEGFTIILNTSNKTFILRREDLSHLQNWI